MTVQGDPGKKALRQEALSARRSLSADQRAKKSAAIGRMLQAQPFFLTARCVFAYASMEDEVHTEEILRGMLARGQEVALPYIVGKGHMEAAALLSLADLEEGAHGIRTPKEAGRRIVDPNSIDLILVPGVAFSPSGARLGMGGGFYDAFLPRAAKAFRLALAYQCQIFSEIPMAAHDVGVDRVLTENGFLPEEKTIRECHQHGN